MQTDGIGWSGLAARLFGALVLVYGTFNPERYSFFHWALRPIVEGPPGAAGRAVPAKVLVGLLLLGSWIFVLQTTRRSLGWKGALLVLGILGTLVWALIDWHVFTPTSSRAIGHVVLVAVALVVALGMSWSHVSRRVSGQVDTDDTDH